MPRHLQIVVVDTGKRYLRKSRSVVLIVTSVISLQCIFLWSSAEHWNIYERDGLNSAILTVCQGFASKLSLIFLLSLLLVWPALTFSARDCLKKMGSWVCNIFVQYVHNSNVRKLYSFYRRLWQPSSSGDAREANWTRCEFFLNVRTPENVFNDLYSFVLARCCLDRSLWFWNFQWSLNLHNHHAETIKQTMIDTSHNWPSFCTAESLLPVLRKRKRTELMKAFVK